MSATLRREGVPQNVVAPKYIGDIGRISNSTFMEFGQVQSVNAKEMIPLGRGVSVNVVDNTTYLGTTSLEEGVVISGISVSDKMFDAGNFGEFSTTGVLRVGYAGVEMESPPNESASDIFLNKETGVFSGMKTPDTVKVLNVQLIPKWSNSTFAVLYITRKNIYVNKEQ